MHRRSADRLAAVVAAHLQRIVTVDDTIVGPVQLCLLRLVGGEILQRPEIGTGIERDDREAVLGELARQRAAAGAGTDDGEITLTATGVLPHRHPAAGPENIRCTPFAGTRNLP